MQAPPPIALGEKAKKPPTLGQRIRGHFREYWPEYVSAAAGAGLYGYLEMRRAREQGRTVIGIPYPSPLHRVRVANPADRMRPART